MPNVIRKPVCTAAAHSVEDCTAHILEVRVTFESCLSAPVGAASGLVSFRAPKWSNGNDHACASSLHNTGCIPAVKLRIAKRYLLSLFLSLSFPLSLPLCRSELQRVYAAATVNRCLSFHAAARHLRKDSVQSSQIAICWPTSHCRSIFCEAR